MQLQLVTFFTSHVIGGESTRQGMATGLPQRIRKTFLKANPVVLPGRVAGTIHLESGSAPAAGAANGALAVGIPARGARPDGCRPGAEFGAGDRKSTRLNSSHGYISYAVFCLKKKKKKQTVTKRIR